MTKAEGTVGSMPSNEEVREVKGTKSSRVAGTARRPGPAYGLFMYRISRYRWLLHFKKLFKIKKTIKETICILPSLKYLLSGFFFFFFFF